MMTGGRPGKEETFATGTPTVSTGSGGGDDPFNYHLLS